MVRVTGSYRVTRYGDEEVRAFVPMPLPPAGPDLDLGGEVAVALREAMGAMGRLALAAEMVPSRDWFLYGFVRKEALLTSQMEGTQATLQDVLAFEAGERAERPEDVRDVCNYLEALAYARRELARPKGMPLCVRLLCEAHRRLMKGVGGKRGENKGPGEIRRSQNWVGGTRPGNARFVPPPPEVLRELLSALEKWIHATDGLPPLIRAGLAHVQFETIHPFLDGNGRIGRLLIALLVEQWGLLKSPLLYVSVAFKRHQQEYYLRLSAVREEGDWEGWTQFFLQCVREAAEDGVTTAQEMFRLVSADRGRLVKRADATMVAVRLFESLVEHPILALPLVMRLTKVSKPTAARTLDLLVEAGILREITGKRRDRVYAYRGYLEVLAKGTV